MHNTDLNPFHTPHHTYTIKSHSCRDDSGNIYDVCLRLFIIIINVRLFALLVVVRLVRWALIAAGAHYLPTIKCLDFCVTCCLTSQRAKMSNTIIIRWLF